MQETSNMVGIINTIIIILIVILVALIGVVFYYIWQSRKNQNEKAKNPANLIKPNKKGSSKNSGVEPMSKFLDFDEIVDSMIVRKNRQQYIMVIQCKGVNFDLLGEDEKIAVENGFTQFLNTLRFPIQLYVQTRSLNLKNSIDQYRNRVNEVKQDIAKITAQIKREQSNGRLDLVRRLEFEKRRKENILEYGIDITEYVNRLSQNRNVLQQNTYVTVAYYTSEFGGEIQNYAKEEIDNIAFSELYTRAQTLIRGLSAAGVSGRVINSEELAELLFIAYNRDESDVLNMKKLVENEYDGLYNIAKDVMEKQKELIEKKLDEEAIDLAASSITKANNVLLLRKDNQEEIKDRAEKYVDQYKYEMTKELYDETINQIKSADLVQGEAKGDDQDTKKEETPKKPKKDLTPEQRKILLERRRRRKIQQEKMLQQREQQERRTNA